jgi:CHAD domain-containing protein
LPYRFNFDSMPQNVRRIATEQINRAISQLRRKDPAQRDKAVHEARKSIKRLRALLRLMRPGHENWFQKENAALRDIGHRLSDLRDATIVLETFDSLTDTPAEQRKLGAIRYTLQEEKEAKEAKLAEGKPLQDAAAALTEVAERVAQWPLDSDGFDAIAAGLKAEYRKGRKAMAKALKKNDSLLYHDWRKRAKCQLYHIHLLENLETDSVSALEKQLHSLETALGDDHNLLVLRQHLDSNPHAGAQRKTLRHCIRLIADREAQLRTEAKNLGEKVYTQTPREFVEHLRTEWQKFCSVAPPKPKPARVPRRQKRTAA